MTCEECKERLKSYPEKRPDYKKILEYYKTCNPEKCKKYKAFAKTKKQEKVL